VPEVDFVSLRALRSVAAPLLAVVALTTGLTAGAITVSAPAFASTASMESQFIADINAARQANGLRPYAVAGDLTSVARGHSATMASKHSLYHNPSLTTQVPNWQAVGENVGEGPSVGDIHQAFMNSPEHRSNILDHDFTQVGVGVSVDKDGIIWVTEDFRQPMGSTSTYQQPKHHHSATSQPTTTTTSPTTAASRPTVSSSGQGGRPHAAPSPQAVLRHRLHLLRHHHTAHPASDPVAQSFHYVWALSELTR
jgi:hypothetical protein